MLTDTARFSVAFSLSGAVHVAVLSVMAPDVAVVPTHISNPLQIQIQVPAQESHDLDIAVPLARSHIGVQAQPKRPLTRPKETFSSPVAPLALTPELSDPSLAISQSELPAPSEEKVSINREASAVSTTPDESSQGTGKIVGLSTNNANIKKFAEEKANSSPDKALTAPGLIFSTRPEYPEEARWEKRQGRTLLMFQLTSDGSVKEIKLLNSSGHDDLDAAAVQALRKWRFNVPASTEGSPWYKYALRFDLL